jgi:glycosyltransferase involved in cell wall biosynthesis
VKLLFITSEFVTTDKNLYPGGIATYTFNIVRIIQGFDCESTVLCLGSRNETFYFHGIKCVTIRNSTYRLKCLLNVLTFSLFKKSLSRVLDAFVICMSAGKYISSADVVHITNWKYPGLFIPKNRKFILRISSYEKFWDNEPNLTTLDKRLNERLEKKEIKSYNNIIGPGQFIIDVIDSELNTISKFMPTPYVGNILNLDYSLKRPQSILFVGTLGYSKGVDLLLDISDKTLRNFPDSQITIVGKFSNVNVEANMFAISKIKEKYKDRFIHIVNLNREELNVYYSKSEIVCIPSVYDNFPNVALEGMANSCIVVASNTSSLDTLITNDENGYIVDTRNVEDWIKVIQKIFNMNLTKKLKLQSKIPESMRQHSPDDAGKKLVEYYKSIIS